MKNKRTSGISLVALIVTIIVLIILTAAVIVTFMEGGIIDRTKEAVFKSDIRTYQEILAVKNAEKQIELATGNGEGTELNADTLEKIQEIIPEFKEEYKDLIAISNGEIVLGSENKEPYSVWLADLGIGAGKVEILENSVVYKLEVGDYVNYDIPEEKRQTYTIGDGETSWIFNDVDVDNSYDEGEDLFEYQEINWRVLRNDRKIVTLVSEEPVYNVYLYGANGYVYGPSKLDEICATVYGGRNLKIEDVNEILKGDRNWGNDETNWMYYGTDNETHNVPEGVRTIAQLEESEAAGVRVFSSRETPEPGKDLGQYEPNNYYYHELSCTMASNIEKELIFNCGEYCLSSTCVDAFTGDDCVYFNIRHVNSDNVTADSLYDSMGYAFNGMWRLRPVVTLSASTQIADVTGDGSSADSAWQLK